jgi:hypothetical protein
MARKTNKPIVAETKTGEGLLKETDRGIYVERTMEVKDWGVAVPRMVDKFHRSKASGQQLVDGQMQGVAELVRIARTDEREHVRTAAGNLACSLSMMKMYLREDDVLGAAFCGILVGTQAEQLRIKIEHEENAAHGKKIKAKLGTARATKADKTDAEHAKIRQRVKALMAANRKNTITYARKIAADEMKCSLSKVLRATKGMKK